VFDAILAVAVLAEYVYIQAQFVLLVEYDLVLLWVWLVSKMLFVLLES
jgi:hypothetical protein